MMATPPTREEKSWKHVEFAYDVRISPDKIFHNPISLHILGTRRIKRAHREAMSR